MKSGGLGSILLKADISGMSIHSTKYISALLPISPPNDADPVDHELFGPFVKLIRETMVVSAWQIEGAWMVLDQPVQMLVMLGRKGFPTPYGRAFIHLQLVLLTFRCAKGDGS